MEPSPPYSYSSVFEPGFPETPWHKLASKNPISEFHSKYWGQSIDQDESEWRAKQADDQPTQPTDNMADDQPAQPTDDMDVDERQPVLGCFSLNLDIRLRPSRLWVREDYVRLYDRCDAYYNEAMGLVHNRPSVVITGQPGIGE
jgi:hypothetical protein